jgi:hypothetical protein
MFDRIFKIGLFILGACFLLLYYFNAQHDRYKYLDINAVAYSDTKFGIFDAREGRIYFLLEPKEKTESATWVEISPKGGKHYYDLNGRETK